MGTMLVDGVLKAIHAREHRAHRYPRHSRCVKMVLASAVNAEGEQIYPRKWNHDFVGMPILKKEEEHRPSVTEAELGEILASAKKRYAVLFALLAGTGLRIGEALGLQQTDLSPCRRVLYVRRSIGMVESNYLKLPTPFERLISRNRWRSYWTPMRKINPCTFLQPLPDGLYRSETFSAPCTIPEKESGFMPSADSERKPYGVRGYRRT